MRVLILHNTYRQAGGEDRVMQDEAALLRSHGDEVEEFECDNSGSALSLAPGAVWSRDSYQHVRALCRRFQPSVAHVHNFWMRLSPAVHAACRESGVPTVQTLHNYRLLCTNAMFLRDGKVCEDCLGKLPWRGVLRRCYRGSLLSSAAVGAMVTANRLRHTWDRDVTAFIALSRHAAAKFAAGGIDASKTFIKPNFSPDPGGSLQSPAESDAVLFMGRSSVEKGVDTLIRAWTQEPGCREGRLLIAGDGPDRAHLEAQARAAAAGHAGGHVEFLGSLRPPDLLELLRRVRAVVVPSIWYESGPRVIIEAYACGRPIIASDIGAVGEAVLPEQTGLRVPPGDSRALGTALARILRDDALAVSLGAGARQEYLARYTPEQNYRLLMQVYDFATSRRSAHASATAAAPVVNG